MCPVVRMKTPRDANFVCYYVVVCLLFITLCLALRLAKKEPQLFVKEEKEQPDKQIESTLKYFIIV